MLKTISISWKLATVFGAIMIVATGTLGFVAYEAARVAELTSINERVDEEQALAATVENALLTAIADLRGFAQSHDPAEAAGFEQNMKRFDAAAGELAPMLTDPKDAALLAKTVKGAAEWRRTAADPMLASLSRSESQRVHEIAGSSGASHVIEDMTAGAEALRQEKFETVQQSLREMHDASTAEEWAIAAGAAVMLGVTCAFWLLLRHLLGQPVVLLTGVMRRLAGGDNRVTVPETDRGDELGDMARAVLVFRDAAIAKEAADLAKAQADREQGLVVETLSGGLGKLAGGDLTVEIGAGFPESYAVVKRNFNDALTSLRTLIGAVRDGAEAIRSGSGEIATASEGIAKRAESSAASLEETSAAIVQIDGRLQAAARYAAQTVSSADEAIEAVGDGREVTDQAVQAMSRVSESAKGIDTVIEGLDKIAFQTRVLAMNAAVEAGRAGEAGRGFAVVADLVSALAMRAEEEAKRARDQLTATQSDIGSAVEAVRKVEGALARISGGVGEVHSLLGTMAEENEAQASAVREISDAVAVMDHATQQNAAMVEEASAASRSLNGEAVVLAEQAARFRVDKLPKQHVGGRGSPAGELRTVH